MSVISLLKKVKVQTLSFKKHPCRNLDDEIKIHYLNAISLVMNADENITDKQIEYLEILLVSFGFEKDMKDVFVEFAKNPNEDSILEMMSIFDNKDIKYNLIVDCMMMASRDDNILNEEEEAIITEYFEMFKITPDEEAKDLKYIYEMFNKQDGNALYRYFGKQDKYDTFLIKKELFDYLLDYYKIDMAYELKEDEKRILDFQFFKPIFKSGSLRDGATEIMTKPVNNAQFCIYLNYAYTSKNIEFNGEGKIIDSETKGLLMDLDISNIQFKNNEFIVDSSENEDKKITGVTYVMANIFIEWVSEYNNEEYHLIKFDSNWKKKIKDFNHSELLYEFINSIDYGIKSYTQTYDNGLALDKDGTPLNITSESYYGDVSFRMMK
jgi:hypothetical protein